MRPIIYYRRSLMDKEELAAAEKHFDCVLLLSDIKPKDLVIYRYSQYPFAYDQHLEIVNMGATPINTHYEHSYVADLGNYVADLGDMTPKTWDRLSDIPETGPFVLKGATNSKKSNWNQTMFATDRKEASRVHSRLCEDTLVGEQKIYVRQYVSLETYMFGIGGIPITKEFRFFVFDGQVICGGYYWANYVDELGHMPDVNEVPKDFLQAAIDRVKDRIGFFVIDVAKTKSGDWIVIEINSGNASGLSCNDPNALYAGLRGLVGKKFGV